MTNEHFTDDEIAALRLLEQLDEVLRRIVDAGKDDMAGLYDLQRLGDHVWALRTAVLSQGAIRMYPGVCRLLGGVLCDNTLWEDGKEAGKCQLPAEHEGEHRFA